MRLRFATRRVLLALATTLALFPAAAPTARAQWVQTYEQFYLQAPHNWEFRDRYAAADRLFNAFDYGHAILYEVLWTQPNAAASELEEKQYDYLTKTILVRPPRVPLAEGAIEIHYAQLAPEAKQMFHWAHILHRQLYDVLADDRMTQAQRDAEVARVLAYYKTRPDVAFSSRPKSMKLMQEQPYSLAFRQKYPKFNGLIWAYHWLQVGLYEPLMVNTTVETRQAGVRATVARFWQMLEDPPRALPHQMPMTPAVAPAFAARYPEAAIIFDNLHSMHDVISDILANPGVPRDRKRAEILRAARLFRDDTSYVMPTQAWLAMAQHMGVENMGGPAVNFLPTLPTPTVTYGAVMQHDDRTGAMTGFAYGGPAPGAAAGAHVGHDAPQPAAQTGAGQHGAGHHGAAAAGRAAPADTGTGAHAGMHHGAHTGGDTTREAAEDPAAHMAPMMELHMRMMADSVIRRRMLRDTAMRRMMRDMLEHMPAEHRAHMEAMLREPAPAAARPAPTRRAPASRATPSRTTRPAARPATPPRTTRPAPRPADPHAGHTPPPARPPASRPTQPPPDPHAGHRPPSGAR